MVDEFILYDDMQYTRRDWRNRNKIKTPSGSAWLTIPVQVKGRYFQSINETLISEQDWSKTHWATIKQFYGKTRYFSKLSEPFEHYYLHTNETHLSRVNYDLLQIVNSILEIKTKISWSSDYRLKDGRTERLLDLTIQAGGTEYISGPAAKDYLDEHLFENAGIKVSWMDYTGYPEYAQQYPPFEHGVTVLDLIFNEGPNTPAFLKSFRHD